METTNVCGTDVNGVTALILGSREHRAAALRRPFNPPGASKRAWRLVAVLFASCALCGGTAHAQTTIRVSVDSEGNQSPGGLLGFFNSVQPHISADGRFVTWEATAQELVPDDTNGMRDIFVHDLETAETTRVSISTDGAQADQHCFRPRISADGRFVVFHSQATTLVPGIFGTINVFLHDRETGVTEVVSVATDGTPADFGNEGVSQWGDISADGRYVVFKSRATTLTGSTNGFFDIYVRDRLLGTTEKITFSTTGGETNGNSEHPSISGDGRYVVFESEADNLVPGDTNGTWDVFLHDRETSETTRLSVTNAGAQANDESRWPRISLDGSAVTFTSRATNLIPGPSNMLLHVYVRDLATGVNERVTVNSDGEMANNHSSISEISAAGRYAVFNSNATNFDTMNTGNLMAVWLHDRTFATTERVSLSAMGITPNGEARNPGVSADGNHIAFQSAASNLVPGDTNSATDVFVRIRRIVPDPRKCPGDLTGSGSVGVADLLQLLACWGEVGPGNGGASECESADLTGGGSVGVADLLQLLANWGPCPR